MPVVTGGTDNHTVIVSLRPFGVTGSKAELVCDLVNISISKSTIPGDKSAFNPSGIRLGTPSLTSRGAFPQDMVFVADVIRKVVDICVKVQGTSINSLHIHNYFIYSYIINPYIYAQLIHILIHNCFIWLM